MRVRKKLFIDAIAGAGKTTSMINLAASYSERGEVPLILTFQKEDRVWVGKKLMRLGFRPVSSIRRGVSVYKKVLKSGKTAKIYVSNIHSLAYSYARSNDFMPVLVDSDKFFWSEYVKVDRSVNKNPFESDKPGDFLYAGYEIAKSFDGEINEERFREHPAGRLWLALALKMGFSFKDIIEFSKKVQEAKFEYQKFISEKEMEKPERLRQNRVVVEHTDLIYHLDDKIEDVTMVFIDEGQDWKELWYRKILTLYSDCGILIFGDTNQAVFTSSGGVFPYSEILKREFGIKEFVNERFRTTKRAPKGAYDEALFFQVREKRHVYAREGEFVRGETFEAFISYISGKKCTGAVITRTRADEERYYRALNAMGIPAIKSNEEHKWEKVKSFFYGKEEEFDEPFSYSDVEPFIKSEIKYGEIKADIPLNKKKLIEYLTEKGYVKEILEEKFYNLLLNEEEPVRVTTAHRAKGKEYDATFLSLRRTEKIRAIEEELPLLEMPVDYVARTRHREALFTE